MIRPGIELRSPGPLVIPLLIWPMSQLYDDTRILQVIYIYMIIGFLDYFYLYQDNGILLNIFICMLDI